MVSFKRVLLLFPGAIASACYNPLIYSNMLFCDNRFPELGRRLGISTNAAWRMQHKLMQAMLGRDRGYKLGTAGPRIEIDDAYIGGERSGEGSGRDRRGHTPFIVAIETSDDGRPLHARLQVVRGFRASETKRLCAGVAAGTTVVSDGGQWFRCIAEHPARL
jgi:hypothetical protein